MRSRVLITGISGFIGSYLAEYALSLGAEVYGSKRWRSKMENIAHIMDRLNLVECDLKDASSTLALINRVKPDYIFHLAAQSFVPTSWHAPAETLLNNILSQVNLLEAVKASHIDPLILITGSSEEYGLVFPHELPIKETNPLRPLSPYGVSKVTQDLLGYQYHKSFGLRIIRTRAFNCTGPRRPEVFSLSGFAKQIAEIETGRREAVIFVGNLEAKRDFTDVRDLVRAYWLALDKGEPGEVYNIASGISRRIGDALNLLLSLSTTPQVNITQDPSRLRPSDVPVLEGDATKFKQRTGWQAQIPFKQTLEDLLRYWRHKIKLAAA